MQRFNFRLKFLSWDIFLGRVELKPKDTTNEDQTKKEIPGTLSKTKLLMKIILGFRDIWLAFITVLITSLFVYIASYAYPSLMDIFAVSPQTPWGIVTSIFAHAGIEHLIGNMLLLFLFLLYFVVSNFYIHHEEKRQRISFLLITVFSMAIVSNIATIVLMPKATSIGSSGLVFALEGVLMSFSLINSFETYEWFKQKKINGEISLAIEIVNIWVFTFLFLQIVLTPQSFLNVSPGVNIIVHGLSFLSSFVLVLVWWAARRFLNSRRRR
jgi:membrane associated rhomboid family serine protease